MLVGVNQVIDIPPVRPVVVEAHRYSVDCPLCYHQETAAYPAGMEPERVFGSGIESLVNYLHQEHHIGYARLQSLLNEVFHLSISEGTLVNMIRRGASHLEQEAEEIREQVEHWGLPTGTVERIFTELPYSGKFNVGRYTRYAEDLMRVKNALGLCTIYTYQALIFADDMAKLYNAATGDDLSAGDLVQYGERISNVAKLVNVREGFTRADDRPPEVWFRPMDAPEGRIEMRDYYETKVLTRDDVARILDDYYDERGWDLQSGVPTRHRLEELSLAELASEGAG